MKGGVVFVRKVYGLVGGGVRHVCVCVWIR